MSFDVPREHPDRPTVSILFDGRPAFDEVAPGWGGFDPDEILGPGSPLLPVHPWRRVGVHRCSCGIEGCGVIAPLIMEREQSVVWSDFRDYTGVFVGPTHDKDPEGGSRWNLPTVRFSAQQYRAEVARASADRSWETPRRATARLTQTLVEGLVRALGLGDVDRVRVTPAYRADGVTVGLRRRDQTPAGTRWEQLHIPAPTDDPGPAAAMIVAQLQGVPSSDWVATFGRELEER